MPRETNKEYISRITNQPLEPSIEEVAGELGREPTIEVRHIRCPLCGVIAYRDEKELSRSRIIVGIAAGPYPPIGRWQKYGGGSLPSYTGSMKDRPGIMIWSGEEPISEDERQLLIEKLREALQMLGG